MKYSYNWLKKISGTKFAVEKAADLLMMHSFEVENLEKVGQNLKGVIVGEILEINKHPNADKLQLVKVNIGSDVLDVVCGAWNIKVGDKVPVATVGTKLGNLEIKEAEIRGQKSFGMLCAEDELGFGKDHSGIYILDERAKVGNEVAKELELQDDTFEIKVLPDRAHDGLCHLGVAREIAVLEGKKLDTKYYDKLKLPKIKSGELKIEIEDGKLCPRYIGTIMENIEVKDSPEWAKSVFRKLGIKPINNIVDATNYVMLELGQPLHAFDYAIVSGEISNSKSQISNKFQNPNSKIQNEAKVIVRRAKNGEKITLLDETIKELNADDIVIASPEKILGLAGIMGGMDSGINQNTKKIIIEAANFDAVSIRKTRTKLSLQTDASIRFEKGLDPNLTELAMARVIEIISMMDGKATDVLDIYPQILKPWEVKLEINCLNSLLGENIPGKKAVEILELLGIKAKAKKDVIMAEIPTVRLDLKTPEDLIEEIGRIYGYEKIKSQPIISEIQPAKLSEKFKSERNVKDILVGLGFDEVMNYSFYGRNDAQNFGLNEKKHLELENPQSPEQELLRISLLPNILKNVRENLKHFETLDIFEMGKIYLPDAKEKRVEKLKIAGASVFSKKALDNLLTLKGNLEALLEKLYVKDVIFEKDSDRIKIIAKGEESGYIKKVSEAVLESFEIKRFSGEVWVFEMDFEVIISTSPKQLIYKTLIKFPKVRRDISFLLPKNQHSVQEISEIIKNAGGKYLVNVELFDIFEKEEISYAYHLDFESSEKTLESREVEEYVKNISSELEKLGAKIRK